MFGNINVMSRLGWHYFHVAAELTWPAPCRTRMAFGTGSDVAHMAVDAVLGPQTIQHEIVDSEAVATPAAPTINSFGGSDACSIYTKAFQDVSKF
ncbi:hypothetical protein UlMin_027322 [Ulmus minor]